MRDKFIIFFSFKDLELNLVFKSLLVGLAAGGVSILYRLILASAENTSFYLYEIIKNNLGYLPVLLLVLVGLGYFVGYLIESDEMIAGSGLPQLKIIIKKYFYLRMPWFNTLVKKFVGGVIAIFAGLSLGRGGPSIHMGTCVAEGIGNKLGKDSMQRKLLIASGASAGLAATFNAPIAATIFVLEGIFRYISPAILLATALGAVSADFISKKIFGIKPIFDFTTTQILPFDNAYLQLILLGVVLGIFGAGFNLALFRMQYFYKHFNLLSTRTKAIIPFIIAGIIGLTFPLAMGSGFKIIEYLKPETTIKFLMVILMIKFIFFVICLGSDTPGGIFFPSLIIGATLGSIFGFIMVDNTIFDIIFFNNFIILGMAGYITAVLRTPITGMVLIMEMTGSPQHLFSIILVCIIAYIVSEFMYKLDKKMTKPFME